MLLNHGISVDITDNDGRTPLRIAASNGQLVSRELLSNCGIVHIAKEHDWTAILATAENGNVEAFSELLKHLACVLFAFKNVQNF